MIVETFLDQTAQKILSQYPADRLAQLCIVFPTRRAGVFFRKSLKQQVDGAFFLPGIFSMEDFVAQFTNLKELDAITLSFELFEVHKLVNDNKGNFKEFLKYGTTILRDFNELDMYLADINKAFSYLESYSELKEWSVEGGELKKKKKNYLRFFKSLTRYYELLKERLLGQNGAYQGLAFRYLAENHDRLLTGFPYDKVYFAGFNVLSPSEKQITDYFLENSMGEMIWNADQYYIHDDTGQEAGEHLRRLFHQKHYPNDFVEKNFLTQSKDINVMGCPGDIAQVKMAGQLLSSVSDEEEVAIVLADETLLEPMLNSIPDNIHAFNVTMGLPLSETPVYSMVENLFRLHMAPYKKGKAGQSKEGKVFYYYKDIVRVLAHPLVKKFMQWKFPEYRKYGDSPVYKFRELNKAYYSVKELQDLLASFGIDDFEQLAFLWEDWTQNPEKTLYYFLAALQALRDMAIGQGAEEGNNKLLLEYIYRFTVVFRSINNLHTKYHTLKDPDILWRFLIQLINRETVTFRGEPLKGLQMMGMLETRLLDFERVILISANEEFLPGNQHDITLMPYEMRKEYGLPMNKEKAAIYAHHFYSLLQRAEKVDILYNTVIEGNSGSEMSRFVKQIIHELPRYNNRINTRVTDMSIKPDLKSQNQQIVIPKSEAVIQRLRDKAESGFAPTTLNKYRLCPLKYYLEELLELKNQEEVEETIEARTLGIVVHDTLEALYKPLKGMKITKDALDEMKKKYKSTLEEIFRNNYEGNDIFSGKNLLIYNVAKYWIERFLDMEKEDIKGYEKDGRSYKFVEAEEQVETHLVIHNPEPGFAVRFKGKLDRVDRLDNTLRIIDYKTGKVEQRNVSLEDFHQLMEEPAKKEAFQLMTYQWLYEKAKKNGENMLTGILSFPSMQNNYMFVKYGNEKGVGRETIDAFEQELVAMLDEIFDESVPFSQTTNHENCRNCDFRDFCNRHS